MPPKDKEVKYKDLIMGLFKGKSGAQQDQIDSG